MKVINQKHHNTPLKLYRTYNSFSINKAHLYNKIYPMININKDILKLNRRFECKVNLRTIIWMLIIWFTKHLIIIKIMIMTIQNKSLLLKTTFHNNHNIIQIRFNKSSKLILNLRNLLICKILKTNKKKMFLNNIMDPLLMNV